MRLTRLLPSAIFLVAWVVVAAAAARAPAKSSQQIPQVRAQDPCNMGNLNQQLVLKPSDIHSLLMRAYCDINITSGPNRKPPLGNLMQAVKDLETVLRIDPKNYYAVRDYAQVAYLLRYYDFAVEAYTEAVSLEPRDARSYLGRGWAHAYLCQMKDAAADFAQAARMDGSLAGEVPSQGAISRQQAICARPAGPAARNCPPRHIVAFSLSARIMLENEWRQQHPGCP